MVFVTDAKGICTTRDSSQALYALGWGIPAKGALAEATPGDAIRTLVHFRLDRPHELASIDGACFTKKYRERR